MTFPFYNIGIKAIAFPLVNPNLADPRFMQRLLTGERDAVIERSSLNRSSDYLLSSPREHGGKGGRKTKSHREGRTLSKTVFCTRHGLEVNRFTAAPETCPRQCKTEKSAFSCRRERYVGGSTLGGRRSYRQFFATGGGESPMQTLVKLPLLSR